MPSLKQNIPKFYWYRLTKNAIFHIPILVLFYQSRSLSFYQIMILQSVYYFARVISEVPTGALADRVGRKRSLFIGSLLHSLGYFLIFISHSFLLFNFGEILAGMAMSFASGADSALAYDSLKMLNQENRYQKVEGTAYSLRNLGFGLFAPIGGFLATANLALPYLASSLVILSSSLVALSMIEPPSPKQGELSKRKRFYHEIGISLKMMCHNKTALWLILFFALIFLATRLGFWVYQPYMKLVKLPLSLFGLVFALLYLLSAIVSHKIDKIEKRLGKNLTLFLMPSLVILSFVLMSRITHLWSISFFLLQAIVMGGFEPVLKSYLNPLVSSEIRATVLSVQSMGGNLLFAITAPFLGSLVDFYTLPFALLLFAIVVFLFSAGLWWYWVKLSKTNLLTT
jgi:MFS family permease